MRVTVIGLGDMGRALAGALLDNGNTVTVWNRTPGRAAELTGAVEATDVSAAISASELVIVCVLDNEVVNQLLDLGRDELEGRVLVNLTNGTPDQARQLDTRVRRLGADYLDGGIMAVPSIIATPHAFVLYSGSATAFEKHREVLSAFGTPRFVGEDVGMAALYDIALLSGMYGMFGGMIQSIALIASAGVPAKEFAAMLGPWLAAMSGSLPDMAERVDSGDYTTGVGSNLAMQAAAFPNFVETSVAQGISPNLLLPIRDLLQARVAGGHGDEDTAGLVEELRNPGS